MRTLPMLSIALAGLLPAAGAARAAEFTLFVHETAAQIERRVDAGADGQAYWAEYAAFGEALQAAGAIRGGAVFDTADGSGARVGDVAAGAALRLGGYFVIDVADLAAARAWAARVPSVRTGGAVDVWRVLPRPAMAP